jgi:hypothetical protein
MAEGAQGYRHAEKLVVVVVVEKVTRISKYEKLVHCRGFGVALRIISGSAHFSILSLEGT